MSKAEKTKAFIIEKTAPIFNRKGYAGTSLSDLTEATGLSKGALYGNFSGKDEIALAVYDYNVAQVKRELISNFVRGMTPLERLLKIPEFYKSHYSTIASLGGCPILNTAVEADDNHPLLKAKVRGTIAAWKKSISRNIRDGIREGTIGPDVDPEKYACLFLALLEGGIMLSKVTDDISFIYEALDRMSFMIKQELSL